MPESLPLIAEHVADLIRRGVRIPCPAAVEIDPTINPESIAPGVVIHVGSKILGSRTSIGPGSVIGEEYPATIENCRLGKSVALKGGFFSHSVFLDGANMGSGAQVRPGSLLEEEANGSHTVGLKQTILLSYVTLGSLINFCDCLMAGGTSRKNHSEVGSSYIHFNYTPHGDKATPSLIGDVPRGVMLDQPPIFLGGQGGLVGPARIEYGCVIPAGRVCRKDVLAKSTLYMAEPGDLKPAQSRPYVQAVYFDITRLVRNNLVYIGNVQALKEWYKTARKTHMESDAFSKACHRGAIEVIDSVLGERIKRLGDLAAKLVDSVKWHEAHGHASSEVVAKQKDFISSWPRIEELLKESSLETTGKAEREAFLETWELTDKGAAHVKAVAELPARARANGTAWLQAIVERAASLSNI